MQKPANYGPSGGVYGTGSALQSPWFTRFRRRGTLAQLEYPIFSIRNDLSVRAVWANWFFNQTPGQYQNRFRPLPWAGVIAWGIGRKVADNPAMTRRELLRAGVR